MSLLDDFQHLLTISREMQAQAIKGNWDALNALQSQRAACIARLSSVSASQSARDSDEIRRLIGEIQSCDEVVMEHAMPLREQLAAWLPAPSRP